MDARVYSGSGITLLEEKAAKERIAELFSAIHHDCMVQKQPKGMRVLSVRRHTTSFAIKFVAYPQTSQECPAIVTLAFLIAQCM